MQVYTLVNPFSKIFFEIATERSDFWPFINLGYPAHTMSTANIEQERTEHMKRCNIPPLPANPDFPTRNTEILLPSRSEGYSIRNEREVCP